MGIKGSHIPMGQLRTGEMLPLFAFQIEALVRGKEKLCRSPRHLITLCLSTCSRFAAFWQVYKDTKFLTLHYKLLQSISWQLAKQTIGCRDFSTYTVQSVGGIFKGCSLPSERWLWHLLVTGRRRKQFAISGLHWQPAAARWLLLSCSARGRATPGHHRNSLHSIYVHPHTAVGETATRHVLKLYFPVQQKERMFKKESLIKSKKELPGKFIMSSA